MAELKARRDAYRATVVFRLGSASGAGVQWRRTTVPTLASDAAIRSFATRSGARIEPWLVDDAGATGAAVNAKTCKNDQFWQGHQPRLGVPHDSPLHVVRQLLASMRAVGNGPRAGCTKRAEPQCPCPVCPPLFPRSSARCRSFYLPTAEEALAMVVRSLGHVGYNTARADPGPGPGPLGRAGPAGLRPGPARARGFRRLARCGCGASRFRDAGLRPLCFHPTGSWLCFGLRPLLPRAVRWPGQCLGRRLHRRPGSPGV
jgi:hypothetical protein